jgi:prophage regulatory protein
MRTKAGKIPSTSSDSARVAASAAKQLALDIRQPPRVPPSLSRRRQPVRPRATDLDQLLNSADIERVTGRHRCTVFRWMREGRFPAKVIREGRPIGWLRSDVERWLSEPALRVPAEPLGPATIRRLPPLTPDRT